MDALANPRYHMWCRLIPGYSGMNPNRRTAMKIAATLGVGAFHMFEPNEEDIRRSEDYVISAKQIEETFNGWRDLPTGAPTYTLADCNVCVPVPLAPKKKEEAMYNTVNVDAPANFSKEQAAIQHLSGRLLDALDLKNEGLFTKYGRRDDPAPKDAEEMVARITAGKYILKTISRYGQEEKVFKWRDPSVKEDPEGFKKAAEVLDAQRTAVKDAIYVKSADDGLKALQEFEAAELP